MRQTLIFRALFIFFFMFNPSPLPFSVQILEKFNELILTRKRSVINAQSLFELLHYVTQTFIFLRRQELQESIPGTFGELIFQAGSKALPRLQRDVLPRNKLFGPLLELMKGKWAESLLLTK